MKIKILAIIAYQAKINTIDASGIKKYIKTDKIISNTAPILSSFFSILSFIFPTYTYNISPYIHHTKTSNSSLKNTFQWLIQLHINIYAVLGCSVGSSFKKLNDK